jgi:hypothetical protein
MKVGSWIEPSRMCTRDLSKLAGRDEVRRAASLVGRMSEVCWCHFEDVWVMMRALEALVMVQYGVLYPPSRVLGPSGPILCEICTLIMKPIRSFA